MVKGVCVARGACMTKGGMHGEGGNAWQRGVCMARVVCVAKGGGVHGMHTPLLRDTASQCTGGTHSSGMHSCV